ncbi:MAG: hypothetical protein ACTHU0_16955 [Kofleriaceae bacterium]
MRAVRGVLVPCVIAALGASAHASPYRLVAIYKGKNPDQTDKTLEVAIRNDALLPSRADGLELERVALRFERAGLGAVTPGMFRNFSMALFQGPRKHGTASVLATEIDPTASRDLLRWKDLHERPRVSYFDVDVRGKLSADFLCAQELYLRQQFGESCAPKPKADDAAGKPACATAPGLFVDPSQRPSHGLFVDGAEVLFSFCKAKDGARDGNVHWGEALKAGTFGKADDADKLQELHKQRLHRMLISKGVISKFVSPYAALHSGPDAEGQPANLYIEEKFQFGIRLVGELFVLEETDHSRPHKVSEVVDQGSSIVVRADGGGVGDCPDLTEFKYVLETPGDERATIDEVPVRYREGCEVALAVDLKKYLDKQVKLKVLQKIDDKELVLVERPFKVASLGFQWTMPVVSEVVAALNAKAPADLTASSSLPLGIALGRGARVRLALSFAFRASWNTRSFTNLSRYFAIYGHATVLSDPDHGYETELALGAGAAAFQFFHFGWAISMADNHRNYFLLSVDIKDFYKFITAERAD